MKLYFWQNILSPHQIDLLKYLALSHDVTLIVSQTVDDQRKNYNWQVDLNDNIKTKISPKYKDVINILKEQDEDSINIISGFLSYKLSAYVLFISSFFKKNIYIYSESVDWHGFKGILKLFIRKVFSFFLKNYIHGILAIGEKGVEYFKRLGFPHDKIFEFGYFIKTPEKKNNNESEKINIVFVGRLILCKGLYEFIKIFNDLNVCDSYTLKIIGEGPERKKISRYIIENNITNITFVGDIPRNCVFELIAEADVLVLPNTSEEGWGAVVNESLLLGTPVICTHHTGAKAIIRSGVQGFVVDHKNKNEFIEAVRALKDYDRSRIKAIANNTISIEVVAFYLNEIFHSENNNIKPPWK